MYEMSGKIKDIFDPNETNIKILSDYIEEIRTMINQQLDSIGLKLYLERLQSLVNLKLTEMAL
jgi:hypothetical protein